MADSIKKEKIAAAKKKLKQFQQKGNSSKNTPKKNTKDSIKPQANNSTPSDSINNKSEEEVVKTSITAHNQIQPTKNVPASPTGHNQIQPTKNVPASPTGHNLQLGNSSDLNQFNWFDPSRTTASTESLHQLSQQINGLLAESQVYMNGDDLNNSSTSELEKRNQELAALLGKHTQANEQLNNQIQHTKLYSQNVQNQLEHERNSFDEKYKKDVGSLKEQLQVHIQTIGILVAEKTELQSQLGQSSRISEQRLQELEEVSGRLKASRHRVGDLEKNISTSSQSSQQHEKLSRESAKEVDRLKLEHYKLSKSKEEYQQQLSELKEKLTAKVSECVGLEQSIKNLNKKVEMAELYAQQLSSETENSQETLQILAELQQEKGDLLIKLQQYEETFQKMSEEREQISDQYQQYVSQIQRQAEEQHQQVTSLAEDRSKLLTKQHELEGYIHELQQKLINSDTQPIPAEVDNSEFLHEISRLKTEQQELLARHEAQIRDNAQLSRFLEEKEDRINELETTVNTLGEEAGDKTQLLESIQSDKTALSRALTQNKDLKNQLAELQTCFVKMSKDNMELLTKLQTGEHNSTEIQSRLAQQEDELTEIKELVSRKDIELHELRRLTENTRKDEYQQEQINDRLQHYEAQAQLVDTLQNELLSAQDMVDALTTQSSELRTMLIKATEIPSNINEEMDVNKESQRDQVLESLSATIQQLESERNILMSNLKEQRDLSDKLSVRVADLQEDVLRNTQEDLDNDRVGRVEFEQLKTAMTMIQDKYNKVMRDKADLSDKADQLEHLVTQLQGESDTIGEYISLYHHQRALLQQRELHKNEYIGQLAQDREELQGKLGQLQALVMQLLGERNMLHSYHEESSLQPSHEDNLQSQPKPHHHHHRHHRHPNGLPNGDRADWPDYTSSEDESDSSEVEQIVGGMTNNGNGDSTPTQQPSPAPSTPENVEVISTKAIEENDDQTAHKILHLLSEIGHSNLVEQVSFMERNFLPCKYCKGRLMVV